MTKLHPLDQTYPLPEDLKPMTTKNIREEFVNMALKDFDNSGKIHYSLEGREGFKEDMVFIADYFIDKMKAQIQEEIEWAKGKKRKTETEICSKYIYDSYYNQALDDTITHLREELKRIK